MNDTEDGSLTLLQAAEKGAQAVAAIPAFPCLHSKNEFSFLVYNTPQLFLANFLGKRICGMQVNVVIHAKIFVFL